MATVATKLSLAEFELQYGGEKPYYEYWYGEPVQKSMPTWLHSLLQKVLVNLLSKAGYKAGAEVKVKIVQEFHPIPDVIATRSPIEHPYPTKPLEVVVEILSDTDPMSRVVSKCLRYQEWASDSFTWLTRMTASSSNGKAAH
jgi:Uma2 family endonuclease